MTSVVINSHYVIGDWSILEELAEDTHKSRCNYMDHLCIFVLGALDVPLIALAKFIVGVGVWSVSGETFR